MITEKTQVTFTLAGIVLILVTLFGFSWRTSKKVSTIENNILTNSTLIEVNKCDIEDSELLIQANTNSNVKFEITFAEINTQLKYISLGIEELKEATKGN